jgi:hypothetical protein
VSRVLGRNQQSTVLGVQDPNNLFVAFMLLHILSLIDVCPYSLFCE